jgi:hypothetical protein
VQQFRDAIESRDLDGGGSDEAPAGLSRDRFDGCGRAKTRDGRNEAADAFSKCLARLLAFQCERERCRRKKRIISVDASGPRGSVWEPRGLPPYQAWPPP